MKKLFVVVSISSVLAAIWLTNVGAAVGDGIYALKRTNQVKLASAPKLKLRDAALATWSGVSGNEIDGVLCETTFIAETTMVTVDDYDDKGNIIGNHQEPRPTGKQIPLFTCQAYNGDALTDDQYLAAAVSGTLDRSTGSNVAVKKLGTIPIHYGSALEVTWNLFFQAAYGKDISNVYKFKCWRSNPDALSEVTAWVQELKVASPAQFRADNEAGLVALPIGSVK